MNYYDAQRVKLTRQNMGLTVRDFAKQLDLRFNEAASLENCSNISIARWRQLFNKVNSRLVLVSVLGEWVNPNHANNALVQACNPAIKLLDLGYSLMTASKSILYVHFYGFTEECDIQEEARKLKLLLPKGYKVRLETYQHLSIRPCKH